MYIRFQHRRTLVFGLSRHELRFAVIVSSTHLTQHFLMRLIPPLIPILAVALEYPLWQLGLLVSIYSFGGGVAQAPLGILSDRYDRLYILPTGLSAAGASYVLFAMAPVLGRAVPSLPILGYTFEGGFIVMGLAMLGVGLGAAVVHPTGYPLISANVSEDNKGKVLGAFGSFSKVGDAAAPAVIGALILVLVWEQIVLILGVVGVAIGGALFLALRGEEYITVPAGRDEDDEADDDESSQRALAADNRTFLYPLVVIYVFFITKMFSSNGLNTFVPVFIVGVYAYSFELLGVFLEPESVANFYFSALLLSAAASQLVVGGVTDRYDPRAVILGCLGIATVGLVTLAVVDLSPVFLLLVLVVLGAGLWGTNPPRDALISEITPAEREGRTFGYIWTAVQLTGSVMPVLVGYVLETNGFREGFLIISAGTVLAFVSISLLFVDRIYVPAAELGSPVDAETSD